MPLILQVTRNESWRNEVELCERENGRREGDREESRQQLSAFIMEYYTFSSYILQVHAQSALQSNESCLKSNLPLLLQERGADNVEVSKVGPWTEGRTITGHAIEAYWPL